MKLKIREAMASSRIKTIGQLSRKSGVARGYISELVAGKYENPSAKVL
jgi:transcriptional regulator with XRE-family HTH domain